MSAPGELTQLGPEPDVADPQDVSLQGVFVPGEVNARLSHIEVQLFDHRSGHADEVLKWQTSRAAWSWETLVAEFSVIPVSALPSLKSGHSYCWNARAKDSLGVWTPWTPQAVFTVTGDQPTLGTLSPAGLSFSTLTGVRFSAMLPAPLPGGTVRVQARRAGALTWEPVNLLWDSGERTTGGQPRVGAPWGGGALGPGDYEWRIRVTSALGSESEWSESTFVLTLGWQPDPGAEGFLTGYARDKAQVRVVIRSVDIGTEDEPGDRGPLEPPIAVIDDPGDLGVGEWLNTPGEMFFTLPNTHSQISLIEPYLVHYAIEQHRGEGWKELAAGLVVDFDATADETVFYGTDYLGLLSRLYDERYSKKLGIDTPIDKGGAKYVDKAISFIIEDQLRTAKAGTFSPVGFIDVPSVSAWPEKLSIVATFKERLSFILGLMQSHSAGTGKRTRLLVQRAIGGGYRWDVRDTSGVQRDNMVFEYGGLVQGYEVVPFEDFGTRAMGIGRKVKGLEPMYAEAWPADDSDTNKPFPEWRWGRFPKIGLWTDLIDENDLKRRAANLARATGKVGKRIGLALRVDGLSPKDGWDITDAVPIRIKRPPVNTEHYGSGYWVIVGWQWRVFRDGHTDLVLSFAPRDDDIAVDTTIIDSKEDPEPDPVKTGCGHPSTIAMPPGVRVYIDHCNGLIYERDLCEEAVDPLTLPLSPGQGNTGLFVPFVREGDLPINYPFEEWPIAWVDMPVGEWMPRAFRYDSAELPSVPYLIWAVLAWPIPVGATHARLTGKIVALGTDLPFTYAWSVMRTNWDPADGRAASLRRGTAVTTGAIESAGSPLGMVKVLANVDTLIDLGPSREGDLLRLLFFPESPEMGEIAFLSTDTSLHSPMTGSRGPYVQFYGGGENPPLSAGLTRNIGFDLTDRSAVSGDTALPDGYGVDIFGSVHASWGTASDAGSFVPEGAFDSDDVRFNRALIIDLECAMAHLPATDGHWAEWSIEVDFASGQTYEARLRAVPAAVGEANGILSAVYEGSEVAGSPVSVAGVVTEGFMLRFQVTPSGVVYAQCSGGQFIVFPELANDGDLRAGVANIRVGLRKDDDTAQTMSGWPKLVDPLTEWGPCWKVRPPIAWDPDQTPYPLPGQFVEERVIGVGNGVDAYFYTNIDGLAVPYMAGTVRVKVDGLFQDVAEVNTHTGQILLDFIPEVGETVSAEWREAVM